MLVLFTVLLAVVAILLGLLLIMRVRRPRAASPGGVTPEATKAAAAAPARLFSDVTLPAELDRLLGTWLVGTPADGSARSGPPPAKVIWVDHGDEVLVHLDSLRTAVTGESVLVSLDLETDETGRATVVVPFAVGSAPSGGLTFVTDELPRGPEILVRRWGEAVQEAAYAALLELAERHAAERSGRPGGLYVQDGALRLLARTGE